MKNKLYLIVFLVLLSLPILLTQVDAACRISGYTLNSTGATVISSDYWAYCQNAVSHQHIYNTTGGLFSWGGPSDTCSSYCGNVYINATNVSDAIDGRCDQGYPLNAGNVPGWSNTTTKAVGNVTMYAPAAAGCVGALATYACGDLIVEDCTFNSNLDCTVGGGFGIGAVSPITVECLNYRLNGSGAETMFTVLSNNVTIQNCIIDNIDIGIASGADYTTSDSNTITNIVTAGLSISGANYFTSNDDAINCYEIVAADGILSTPGMGTNDGLSVVSGSINDCSVGLAHIAGDSLYVYDSTFGDNISTLAISLLSSNNGNISDSFFTDSYRSIYGSMVAGTIIERSIFTSDNALLGYGITLEDGILNVIWNNTLTGYFDAIITDTETTIQISKNYIDNDGATIPYGITVTASNGDLTNNIIRSSSIIALSEGVNCDSGSDFTYNGNNISKQAVGIYGSTCHLAGSNNKIQGTNSVFNIRGLSFFELQDLVTDEATIDIDVYDVQLKDSTYSGITLPANVSGIGIAYNMTANSPFALVNINISYGTVWPVIEGSLALWKYNGTWTNISGSGVNTGSNFVYSGNVADFSVFAPLGERVEGYNIDDTSCAILRLLLIFMAIAIMAISLWFGWGSYQQFEDGNFNMNELLGKLFAAFIGVIVGVVLLIATADILAGVCLI